MTEHALRFGGFMPPFHAIGEDPTTSLWRDMDLICWLDELGLSEAWVGEHHSGGWSLVSSPELLLAAVAERTKHIKLGTGVVSLPYHHPFTVAERMVQLDHQTRGRIMFGMGAGVQPADAHMFGIAPSDQRRMMAESLDVIHHLLHSPERISRKTDWFTIQDATTHLRPYSQPCFPMLVAGTGTERSMRLAGQYGLSPLTFAGLAGRNAAPLGRLWEVAEEEAAKYGNTMDRSGWRIAICTHVAKTREQAFDQVRDGAARWFHDYVKGTMGAPGSLPAGHEVETMVEERSAFVGSVDDVIEMIEGMLEESGGFGSLLVTVQDWASRQEIKDSFEMIARYVVPHFKGSVTSLHSSRQWNAEHRHDLAAKAEEAARQATAGL
jgi:limonene 1,2-monooxygenase